MTTAARASMRQARARQALRLALAGGAVNLALLVLGAALVLLRR